MGERGRGKLELIPAFSQGDGDNGDPLPETLKGWAQVGELSRVRKLMSCLDKQLSFPSSDLQG